jgi:DNA repair exonuclease SbcCD ATPase subunit
MSEDATQGQAVNEPAVNPDDKREPVDAIPYARFREVNEKYKQAIAEIERIKAEQEKIRQKELEEQGKYKELLAETQAKFEAVSQKAKQWEEYQASRRKALLEKLPEEDRELYDELSLEKLEKVVEKVTFKQNVPRTSKGSPMGAVEGFNTLADAAGAYSKGEIDKQTYEKIKSGFLQRPRA